MDGADVEISIITGLDFMGKIEKACDIHPRGSGRDGEHQGLVRK